VAAVLEKGDTGTKVRELQHRLRQLDWFSGRITGTYGTATVKGVQGFQDKRGYEQTGAVDQRTWTKLVAMTRKPTDDEMHNRLVPGPAILEQGDSGDRVRDLQARLKQIGWFSGDVTGTYGTVTVSAVKGFQGKREIPVTGEVDQRTWDRLTAMSRTPTNDEKHNKTPKPSAAGLDSRCLTGRAMCISKSSNSLVWVVDGKAQLKVDVRFGSELTPTREGAFSVGWKSRNHVSTIYHTPMPYAMFFSGGQAVHYSADFAARGYNGASHGCVNVRNRSGIAWLFDQVRVGDKVIVYR
jgi:peptidoglycan hydrolase-like protein with peptidoglycan-binding domain